MALAAFGCTWCAAGRGVNELSVPDLSRSNEWSEIMNNSVFRIGVPDKVNGKRTSTVAVRLQRYAER